MVQLHIQEHQETGEKDQKRSHNEVEEGEGEDPSKIEEPNASKGEGEGGVALDVSEESMDVDESVISESAKKEG